MRLPWIQVTEEVMQQTAPDLAVMLDWSEPEAGWGLLTLFRWALGRAPDVRPPSHSDVISGPFAARLIARAAGWTGDPEEYVEACCHLAKPILERVEGGIRIRGLDRYDATWGKNNPKEWARIRAEAAAKVAPKPERNRSEPGPEPAPKTKTQTHTTTPPIGPPGGAVPPKAEPRRPAASNDELFGPGNSLRDALEQRWLEARGSGYAWDERRDGHATRRILQLAGDDAREVLRRWDVALATRFPRPTSVADLARHWNAYAAPEETQGATKRAADVPRAAPPPEGACAVCSEPSGADVWGQRLCSAHGVELMDAMGTSPSSSAAARWVADRTGGAA